MPDMLPRVPNDGATEARAELERLLRWVYLPENAELAALAAVPEAGAETRVWSVPAEDAVATAARRLRTAGAGHQAHARPLWGPPALAC